jgi:hypothetical protein
VPPADSIFSLAVELKPKASTSSLAFNSPLPNTLNGYAAFELVHFYIERQH